MNNREERALSPDASFAFEDQQSAMLAGYKSTAEWAVAKLAPMVMELTRRVEALEAIVLGGADDPEPLEDAGDPRPDPRSYPEYWGE